MSIANAKKNKSNFIEGMDCKGGCIGGAFCITSADRAKKNLNMNGEMKNV
ncbi:[Fe-Fe] hydrogenase large subunit C-terminal domain-containing protein [Acetivibrio cellulolyticus]|nr:[Fe-Fe] hydrogenase large subunit C-terminal domain-containing protein [Acetivibrio cellulolyticus]